MISKFNDDTIYFFNHLGDGNGEGKDADIISSLFFPKHRQKKCQQETEFTLYPPFAWQT